MANRNSNRGFGSMDRDRQRDEDWRGGRSSQDNRGWESRNDGNYSGRRGYGSDFQDDYSASHGEDYNVRSGYSDYSADYESDYDRDRGSRQRTDYDYEDDRGNRGLDHRSDYDNEGYNVPRRSGPRSSGIGSAVRNRQHGSAYGGGSSWDGRSDDYEYGYGGPRGNVSGLGRSDYDRDADTDFDYNRGRGRSAEFGGGSDSRNNERRRDSEGGRGYQGGRDRDYRDYDEDYRGSWSSRNSNESGRNSRDWDEDYRGGSRGDSRRGFGSMNQEERRRISAMGGRSSQNERRRRDRD